MTITEKLLLESPEGITVEQIKALSKLDYNKFCSEVLLNAEYNSKLECTNVEYFNDDYIGWFNAPIPIWDFADFCYRIKQEPKMVDLDFTDNLVGEKALFKTEDLESEQLIISKDGGGVRVGNSFYSYKDLRKNFTRLDGTRFEKVVK